MKKINQGDVVFVDFDAMNCVGNEEKGARPTVVISMDVANKNSGLVIVCPITSRKKKKLCTHHTLTKDKYNFLSYQNNIVLTENVRAISKSRIERVIGSISKEDLEIIISKLNNNFML